MFTLQNIMLIFVSALVGGAVQALTGFGTGVIMMIGLTMILPLANAGALSGCIQIPLQIAIMITYWKHIRWSMLLKPLPCYLGVSALGIILVTGRDVSGFKLLFGILLIALACYFIVFNGKISVSGGWKSACICGGSAGLLSGMFGIGGPPMAIYTLAVTNADKAAYLGTIQTFFFIATSYNTILRFIRGAFLPETLPLAAVGIAAVLIGKKIGTAIVNRIDTYTMSRIVYIFVGISGLIYVIQNI